MAAPGCHGGEEPPGAVEPAEPAGLHEGLREVAWRISLAVERARGRAALRESEERYVALFQGIDDGFCTIEMRIEAGCPLDFRIVEVNGAFERQSTISGARGRWMRELVPACEEWWYDVLGEVALTGAPRRFEGTGGAVGNRRFDVCAFRIGAPQHRRVGVLFKDITEQHRLAHALRRSEDELERRVRERTLQLAATCAALERELHDRRVADQQVRALVSRLVTVQEDERRAVACAVHDDLAQPVTAARMYLAALTAGAHADLLPHIERLQVLTDELDGRIDRLMRSVGPAAPEEPGLGVALQNLVGEWSRRSGVPAEVQALGMDGLSLPRAAAVHLYRIAEEALQNVAQHAGATHVSVIAERCRRRLVLIVEDNGRGFDSSCAPAEAPHDMGVGLVSMRERAALVGGELEVESSPGVGTVVYVRLEVD